MLSDYDIIKKKFGEKMAKDCRSLFPTLMDKNGELSKFLLSKFYPNKSLYHDIMDNKKASFKKFVYSIFNLNYEHVDTGRSVKELLDEAGYFLYECHTNEDIQKFKKYYAPGEEICTFKEPDRINKCHVFFAVKKDVDNINRKDFPKPYREDLYGTSVISIQFDKGDYNYLSIKNRYNHTVEIPDATFSNELDNIAFGLTKAFEKEYNLNIDVLEKMNFDLDDYYLAPDGRFYRCNNMINDIYYCTDNIIIDKDKILKVDGSRYRLVDYFLIDIQKNNISLYDKNLYDSFCTEDIDSIDIDKKSKDEIIYTIKNENGEKTILYVDGNSRIIGVVNNDIKKIEDNYLSNCSFIKYASFSNCKSVGFSFMSENEPLSKINLDNCEYFGDNFLCNNNGIKNVSFKNAKIIGNRFFCLNTMAETIDLPLVTEIGADAFYFNEDVKTLTLNNAENIGDFFFHTNNNIDDPQIPKLKQFPIGSFGSRIDVAEKLIEIVNNNGRKNTSNRRK